MAKLRSTLLAAVLVLPLVAFGAGRLQGDTLDAGVQAAAVAGEQPMLQAERASGWDCCWVWFSGIYWCIPC